MCNLIQSMFSSDSWVTYVLVKTPKWHYLQLYTVSSQTYRHFNHTFRLKSSTERRTKSSSRPFTNSNTFQKGEDPRRGRTLRQVAPLPSVVSSRVPTGGLDGPRGGPGRGPFPLSQISDVQPDHSVRLLLSRCIVVTRAPPRSYDENGPSLP